MYFNPVAACRDPTRGMLDRTLTICELAPSNRGLSRLGVGIKNISDTERGLLEEHYFSEPQHYEVCWGLHLSSAD